MCNLCGSNSPLKQSHIIPKFVGRWIKETSPTPYLRFGGNMDKRQQDLMKMELLCGDCENRLSLWESKFANEVFYPSAADKTLFRYGPWFVKFASSLAWRALQVRKSYSIQEPPEVNIVFDDMELHLSRLLLGNVKHVSSYTQHVYHVGELAAPLRPGSPNLNRYLARTPEIDFIRSDDLSEIMVYVKLPMFMFFSVGESKHRKYFETSRIRKSGVLRPKKHALDASMLNYLVSRADRIGELFDSMSPKSKAVADKAVLGAISKDPERVANSKQMRAMLADYQMYGEDAVVYRD